MNKIIVDEYEKNWNNLNALIEIKKEDAHIHLSGNNEITNILMNNSNKLTITLEENASLNLNANWFKEKKNLEIFLNCKSNTTVKSHCYIETDTHFQLNFQTNLEGNHNKCEILFSVVTEKEGNCFIKSSGKIVKNTKENELLEEIKGLSLDKPSITFIPELIVDSMDVTANHNATIKCLDKEELFYFASKGIKKEDATILIKNGFLNQLKTQGGGKNES